MRKLVFAAATILSMASPSVGAPIGHSAGGIPAAEATSRAEPVACWGYGWRGFDWYPDWNVACWGPQLLGPSAIEPPIYAAPRSVGRMPPYPPYTPPFEDVRRCWIPDNGPNAGHWHVC
jgi:hypothetical protein